MHQFFFLLFNELIKSQQYCILKERLTICVYIKVPVPMLFLSMCLEIILSVVLPYAPGCYQVWSRGRPVYTDSSNYISFQLGRRVLSTFHIHCVHSWCRPPNHHNLARMWAIGLCQAISRDTLLWQIMKPDEYRVVIFWQEKYCFLPHFTLAFERMLPLEVIYPSLRSHGSKMQRSIPF